MLISVKELGLWKRAVSMHVIYTNSDSRGNVYRRHVYVTFLSQVGD